MVDKLRVSIVGGSGYVGGELLRLLLDHPFVTVQQVTSERNAGRYVHFTHPNLRGRTRLQFVSVAELEPCDLLFVGLPHGATMERIDHFASLAERIIDLSADFRLRDPVLYERWYGKPHANPAWLERFVYGLPELHREEIAAARYVSGVGCNATATNLAILPLFAHNLVDPARGVICEVKVGSSEGGNSASDATHHPERAGVMRSFAPTGHRHTAEILQAIRRVGGETTVHLSATAVDNVRGVLATAHLFAQDGVEEKDLWRAYRRSYQNEPFIRLVKEKTGIYRYPEPKILAGSNYADVGFDYDPDTGRIVALCAIDNLMKGAAGSAVQAMNLMLGWEETTGLTFPGLHPV
ncbi:N-acetyl-gamma-glutamyl-phosphate reductase [Litorilinea aerophila]|uniref:Putative [LysW]-L-2-aminoadipate 6-phosphate reductase n=1 Tax=Litorilinea aerophila TaxID=1204385 RepID=A0A540VGW9_9CHLR|nr:N-acetyl-gamma-glutamyl-phosphate reductase [Litorilinea aerophila]MCC9076405.1 N-acetyl-gamma-glutamyl-phosphate reductase [Litorilinea aerophila]